MPRNYQRKAPHRMVVTNDQFDAAKRLIAEGFSKRKAAEQVGMKESTLRKRLKSDSTAAKLGRFTPTFTTEQENDIYNYVKRYDDLYYGINMTSLRMLIYEYAEINRIPHRFNHNSKMAGRDWVYGFLKRYPDLNLRQPTSSEQNILQNFTATISATLFASESLPSTSNASMTSESLPSTSSKLCTLPISSHSSTATDFALAVVTTPLSSSPVVDTRSNEFIPLSSIQPFPKAKGQTRRRKGKKSIIATDSPFKSELINIDKD